MAASSLLALIDDIAAVLDDVAVMTKVAAKKTAGVLGDDLALNAEQVAGVRADRELPVVWAVAKGSALNKLILVPAAVGISAVAPWAIGPLLMVGGLYLCFEGAEKLAHKIHQRFHGSAKTIASPEVSTDCDHVAIERTKVKGAVRTDFVLSAEIIVIALGTVSDQPLGKVFAVLTAISALMTVGVYGLVAGIVKLDDFGFYLTSRPGKWAPRFGRAVLAFAPRLMRSLGVVGTVAMFLVGGGIVVHGWPWLHHAVEAIVGSLASSTPAIAAPLELSLHAATGIISGALVLAAVAAGARIVPRKVSTAV